MLILSNDKSVMPNGIIFRSMTPKDLDYGDKLTVRLRIPSSVRLAAIQKYFEIPVSSSGC